MIKEKIFNLSGSFFPEIPEMESLYQKLFTKGKVLRGAITFEVSTCLNLSLEKKNTLSRIAEYIHQSSILHDDVIDASPIRRDSLSSWMQYSMKRAILAGDYLLAQAAEETAELDNIPLMKLTSEVLKKLVRGEWMQASLKDKENLLDLNQVHELKTSSLFIWSLRAPFLLIDRYEKKLHKTLSKLGGLQGILFQRADDLLDFDIRNTENKASFKDMQEGQFNSFAVYLSEGKTAAFRENLKTCRSLEEVKNLTGEEVFKQILSSFDQMNQKIIEDCFKQIDELKPLLQKEELALPEMLKKWTEKFYWRANV